MNPRSLLLAALLPLPGCSPSEPHLAFCERALRCSEVEVFLDDNRCASQLQSSLRDYSDRCRSCVLSLTCEGMARAIRRAGHDQRSQLTDVCAQCSPLTADAEAPPEPMTGFALRQSAASSDSPALAFCRAMDSCGLELLVSAKQCATQLDALLADVRASCAECVTNLSCGGAHAIVVDHFPLNQLCASCPASLADDTQANANPLLSTLRERLHQESTIGAFLNGLTPGEPTAAVKPDQRRTPAQSE